MKFSLVISFFRIRYSHKALMPSNPCRVGCCAGFWRYARFGLQQRPCSGSRRTAVPHPRRSQPDHSGLVGREPNGSREISPSRCCLWLVPGRYAHCWQGRNSGHCAWGCRCRGFRLVHCVVSISDRHSSFPIFFCTVTRAIKSQE